MLVVNYFGGRYRMTDNASIFARVGSTLGGDYKLNGTTGTADGTLDPAAFFEIGSLEFDDPSQRDIAQFKRSLGGEIHPSLDGQLELSELKLGSLRWLQTAARVARREIARLRR